MKKVFVSFLAGILAGAGGYWYLTEQDKSESFQAARDTVVHEAGKVTDKIKEQVDALNTDEVKEELARTSMVVREKAKQAGDVIADVTANARITAAIKGKFLAESGFSSFHINVDTTDGLVTLSGTVSSPEDVAKAVRLALDTDGVHKVISTLQVRAEKK